MEHYRYKQGAIFADETSARAAEQHIKAGHFADIKLFVLAPTKNISATDEEQLEPENAEAPNSVVRDAIYGAVGGAALGATASLVAGLAEFALFVSHPIALSLAVIGYGTVIGATSGSLVGEHLKEGLFVVVLENALQNGHWVVIAHAADKDTSTKIGAILDQEQNAEKHVHVR